MESRYFYDGPCLEDISGTMFRAYPTRVEARSNTSTVTMLVVGGGEKFGLKKDYAGENQHHIKKYTRPLVRECAPQKQDRNCQTVINIW
jgi:hypothetical protein